MPRLPLIFGITLAWCCGRETHTTAIPQGDGGQTQIDVTGGRPPAAGSGSIAEAGHGPDSVGGTGPGAPAGGAGASSGGETTAGSGSSGEPSSMGGAGAANGAGAAGEAAGGAPGPSVDTKLCTLVGDDPRSASSKLGSLYRVALANDCRYAALSCGVAIENKIFLANALVSFGPALWHCAGTSAATRFDLVFPGRTLTTIDAQALIDLYVAFTLESFPFTLADGASIRAELGALATTIIDEDAVPISLCNPSGTWSGCAKIGEGTGGAGSAGSSSGGAGGSASGGSSGGGTGGSVTSTGGSS